MTEARLSRDGDNLSRKKELRQQVLSLRQQLSESQLREKSQQITRMLESIPALNQAQVVMGYAPFRNEVDIFPWLMKKWQAGVKILLPRVVNTSGDLEAVPLEPDQDLLANKLGVNEPQGAAVDPGIIAAIIVPGVVFDSQGYRLGYGKGFYDRFLPRLRPGTFVCGVAFQLQLLDEVPHDEYDYRLDHLVTEQGVYHW